MGARQRRGVVRVVDDRKRQGVVSPGMAQPIQGLGRLLCKQPFSQLLTAFLHRCAKGRTNSPSGRLFSSSIAVLNGAEVAG